MIEETFLNFEQVKSQEDLITLARNMAKSISLFDKAKQIDTLNQVRKILHEASPFKGEPVDYVEWVPAENVRANDYNPNSVAPPEMELLALSIMSDGYTQPIVTWGSSDGIEVVDGFHRNRVGKENPVVNARVSGYLPVVGIKAERQSKNDRIAATIRHNRARGKHKVDAMSDIVLELKRRNWSNEKVAKELGMEADEVLRLCQISGLSEAFADQDFSAAWEVQGYLGEDEVIDLEAEDVEFRRVSKNGENRIFHTYHDWECYRHGFYKTGIKGRTKAACEQDYCYFLADLGRFEEALARVVSEWVNSCEHYLTNTAMNRIAWLGQASACLSEGLPSCYRSGFGLLTEEQQSAANDLALKYLNKWLVSHDMPEVSLDEAMGGQVEVY